MYNLTVASRALRNLHKALIAHQAQAVSYTGSSLELYKLVTEDANFAWLKPMTALVVDLDQRSRDDVEYRSESGTVYMRKITDLLSNSDIKSRLNSALQTSPDAGVALGALRALLP